MASASSASSVGRIPRRPCYRHHGTTPDGIGINPDSLLEGWKVTIPGLVPPCPTDSNGDGTVNVTDLLALLAAWGPCP